MQRVDGPARSTKSALLENSPKSVPAERHARHAHQLGSQGVVEIERVDRQWIQLTEGGWREVGGGRRRIAARVDKPHFVDRVAPAVSSQCQGDVSTSDLLGCETINPLRQPVPLRDVGKMCQLDSMVSVPVPQTRPRGHY